MSIVGFSLYAVVFIIMIVWASRINLDQSITLIYAGIGLSILLLRDDIRVHSIGMLFLTFGMQIALIVIGLFKTIRSGIGIKDFARKSIMPIAIMTFIVLISRLILVSYFKH
jgi:hypothetical protein